jgi:hypothetical protein
MFVNASIDGMHTVHLDDVQYATNSNNVDQRWKCFDSVCVIDCPILTTFELKSAVRIEHCFGLMVVFSLAKKTRYSAENDLDQTVIWQTGQQEYPGGFRIIKISALPMLSASISMMRTLNCGATTPSDGAFWRSNCSFIGLTLSWRNCGEISSKKFDQSGLFSQTLRLKKHYGILKSTQP